MFKQNLLWKIMFEFRDVGIVKWSGVGRSSLFLFVFTFNLY